jgi:hypothetical protein
VTARVERLEQRMASGILPFNGRSESLRMCDKAQDARSDVPELVMRLLGKILLPLFAFYGCGILLSLISGFIPALRPLAVRVEAAYFFVLLGYTALAVCGVILAVPAAMLLHWLH